MRKVLLVTYYWPPKQPDFACRHAEGLWKHLPQFGWLPTVETAEEDYKDSFGFIKKILGLESGDRLMHSVAELKRRYHIPEWPLRLAGEWLAFPDAQKGWKLPEWYNPTGFDAILSISPPATSQVIASQIHERFKIPWMAYLLDPWSQNHYYVYSRLRRYRDRKLELSTLAGADAIATVSLPIAERMSKLHSKVVHSIPVSYNPDLYVDEVSLTENFTITYTGNIYEGYQDPEPVLDAIVDIDVNLRFYGEPLSWLDRLIKQKGLQHKVKQMGLVSHKESIRLQRESQVLLLLPWQGVSGIVTSKIQEYKASGRPVVTGEDIRQYYQEWAATGEVKRHQNIAMSQVDNAREIARVLDGLI